LGPIDVLTSAVGMVLKQGKRQLDPEATKECENKIEEELENALEEFGFEKNDIHRSISQQEHSFNQITASLFLLQQQKARQKNIDKNKQSHEEGKH